MVNKFKNDAWYKIDLIMVWESDNRTATVYVEKEGHEGISEPKGSSVFFGDKKSLDQPNTANTLFLYNLAPDTTCYIKNLKVCEGRCAGKIKN